MKAISHQRKAMQVTQCHISASMMARCVFASHALICVLRMMRRPRTTQNIKTSRSKPQQAIVPTRSRESTHLWGKKSQIKWHSTSLHAGDNQRLQITKIREGDIFFSPPNTKGSSSYFRPLAYMGNLDVWKKGSGAATRDPRLYRWGYAVTVRKAQMCASALLQLKHAVKITL